MKKYILGFIILIGVSNSVWSQKLVDFPDCGALDEARELHYKTVWAKPFGPSVIFDSLDFSQFKSLDVRLDTMLAALNYSDLVNKYFMARYHLQQGNKDLAVILFKEIMRFPFWGQYRGIYIDKSKNLTFQHIFFEIYWKSGVYLIKALNGNLEELNKLEFVPASNNYLLPRLRDAIENAGGEWTRGDTNFQLQDNDLKNFENHFKKHKNDE
jgi:hypothetical protein